MSIATNLDVVRAKVAAAATAAGRDPNRVRLVAASKTQPPEVVREALAAGQIDFGENYAQELRDKAEQVPARARWHFIGSLQRNKVKYVVGRAELIHDVDSLALATEIGRRSLPRRTGVLLGVNIAHEPQKSGLAPDLVLDIARQLVDLPGVELRGLMCIPPAEGDPRPHFGALASLAESGRAQGLPLDELSMGMSDDYELAIAAGATIVRVGTAIFGARAPIGR